VRSFAREFGQRCGPIARLSRRAYPVANAKAGRSQPIESFPFPLKVSIKLARLAPSAARRTARPRLDGGRRRPPGAKRPRRTDTSGAKGSSRPPRPTHWTETRVLSVADSHRKVPGVLAEVWVGLRRSSGPTRAWRREPRQPLAQSPGTPTALRSRPSSGSPGPPHRLVRGRSPVQVKTATLPKSISALRPSSAAGAAEGAMKP
jgi:hypothetical protein